MTPKLLAAMTGALLALPLLAQAQSSRPPADPADPGAAVPPIVFQSVIAAPSRAPQESQVTPDKAWLAANAAVAAAPGHGGHGGHTGHASGQHGQAPATPPASARAAKPASPPPMDHSKHH